MGRAAKSLAALVATPGLAACATTSVETLVYSLSQNKLIWATQSKTTNPANVDSFVREIVGETAKQMKKAGVI
jgi:uncharacterized lipoprotein YmbA